MALFNGKMEKLNGAKCKKSMAKICMHISTHVHFTLQEWKNNCPDSLDFVEVIILLGAHL